MLSQIITGGLFLSLVGLLVSEQVTVEGPL